MSVVKNTGMPKQAKIFEFEKQKKKSESTEECFSLDELMKLYPGLTFENAALLTNAHQLAKKSAA